MSVPDIIIADDGIRTFTIRSPRSETRVELDVIEHEAVLLEIHERASRDKASDAEHLRELVAWAESVGAIGVGAMGARNLCAAVWSAAADCRKKPDAEDSKPPA